MSISNTLLILATAALTAGATLAFTAAETPHNDPISASAAERASADVTERIRLYSAGTMLGEWEGIGRGQLEGDTYTFKVDRGAFSREMRIRGDFTVETFPN